MKGPDALTNIVSGVAGAVLGVPGCIRGDNPLYQYKEQSCTKTVGAGVGANIQEIRNQVRQRF